MQMPNSIRHGTPLAWCKSTVHACGGVNTGKYMYQLGAAAVHYEAKLLMHICICIYLVLFISNSSNSSNLLYMLYNTIYNSLSKAGPSKS